MIALAIKTAALETALIRAAKGLLAEKNYILTCLLATNYKQALKFERHCAVSLLLLAKSSRMRSHKKGKKQKKQTRVN